MGNSRPPHGQCPKMTRCSGNERRAPTIDETPVQTPPTPLGLQRDPTYRAYGVDNPLHVGDKCAAWPIVNLAYYLYSTTPMWGKCSSRHRDYKRGPTSRMDANQTNPQDVLPLIKSNPTIPQIAERFGISIEAACALVVATLRASRAPLRTSEDEDAASPPRETDNAILLSAGSEPAEGSELWRRNGRLYGREAALQLAFGA